MQEIFFVNCSLPYSGKLINGLNKHCHVLVEKAIQIYISYYHLQKLVFHVFHSTITFFLFNVTICLILYVLMIQVKVTCRIIFAFTAN